MQNQLGQLQFNPNYDYNACLQLQQQLLTAPDPRNPLCNYVYAIQGQPMGPTTLENEGFNQFKQQQKMSNNNNLFKPIILLQQQPQCQQFIYGPMKDGQINMNQQGVKIEENQVIKNNKMFQFNQQQLFNNNTFVPFKPQFLKPNNEENINFGLLKVNQSETDSSSIHKNSITTLPLRAKIEESEDNLEELNQQQYLPILNKKIKKDKKLQEKQGKAKEPKQSKRVNTSHVPLNMYNQLYFHLLDIYKNKMICKCIQVKKDNENNNEKQQCVNNENDSIVKIEEQQTQEQTTIQQTEEQNQTQQQQDKDNNNNQDNTINSNNNQILCKKCLEWQKIEAIKKLKKKNIETFRLLWSISKRVQVLSENFFLRHATISILSNKMYRTPESKSAVYTCLPNFVLGSRNYQTFYRILG